MRGQTTSLVLLAALGLAACGGGSEAEAVRLATTTSTRDSGLLDHLLPLVRQETGIDVAVLAVGSGQALRLGADGDADLLLTHDPLGEESLVASGAASERRPLMYNDFVIVGPPADPAGVEHAQSAPAALARIAHIGAAFLSRGDDSGTHRKERRLWLAAGVEPRGDWYRETGQGMGATLAMAAETGSYTLSDRSTWSAHGARDVLPVLAEGDPLLRNPYAVLLVDASVHPEVRVDAARRVADWLTGPGGRAAIRAFRPRGEQLFLLLDEDE